MHVLIDRGDYQVDVHIPEEFDDLAETLIRYLSRISRIENITPCWVVTYSLTPLLYEEEDPPESYLELCEFMHAVDFVRENYDMTSGERVLPREEHWEGLPERISDYLIRHWESRDTVTRSTPYCRLFHERRWPKKPPPSEVVGRSRYEREDLV